MSLSDLTQYDDAFKDASFTITTKFVPDAGEHRVIVENIEFADGEYGMQVFITFRDLDQPGSWRRYYPLSEEKIAYLKKDLKIMGYDREKISELPKYLEEILGVALIVRVKHYKDSKGEDRFATYVNSRMKNVIEHDDVPF
jgi:hypothetical protein